MINQHRCLDVPGDFSGFFQSPGIPWDATEKQIRNDFGECGEIEELAMPSKAVFITFKSKAGADKALEYDGDQYGKGTLQALLTIQNGEENGEENGDALRFMTSMTCIY